LDDLLSGICQHAASLLYLSATVVGQLVPVTTDYKIGAEEAALSNILDAMTISH
jgi:hypothetical protein